jgi:hypothetical protein
MLALVIFGLVTIGILATFRTAVRSYERSGDAMAAVQTVRAVTDALSRDLRAAFLINETNYGIALPTEETDANRDAGVLNPSQSLTGVGNTGSGIIDLAAQYEEQLVTDQLIIDPSLDADMTFTVTDGGEADTVSLVRRLRSMTSRRAQPWGLVRLTYSVNDGRLVRSVDSVCTETQVAIPLPGETLEEARERTLREAPAPPEPREEVLASGVEIFNVRCAYWMEEGWLLADEWNSSEKKHRNPLAISDVEVGDPNYPALLAALERVAEDGLPAALEVHLALREEGTGRRRVNRMVIPLMAAQETWTPPDENLLGDAARISRGRASR